MSELRQLERRHASEAEIEMESVSVGEQGRSFRAVGKAQASAGRQPSYLFAPIALLACPRRFHHDAFAPGLTRAVAITGSHLSPTFSGGRRNRERRNQHPLRWVFLAKIMETNPA